MVEDDHLAADTGPDLAVADAPESLDRNHRSVDRRGCGIVAPMAS
jgi:hypothetical protein